jgi:hypothetical protein
LTQELDACDVGGVIRREECHRCGDFLRPAEALRRDLLKQDLAEFLDIGFGKAELAEKGRLDYAGADGVDADVPADQLRGKRPGEVAQCRLGGGHG